MTKSSEYTPHNTAKPAFPELTPQEQAQVRELCAGDMSRGDITLPNSLLETTPKGMTPVGWTRMLAEGEQLRKAEGGPAKKTMAERMLARGTTEIER